MRTLISLIETISLWTGRLAALLLVPLVFAMVYEVVSRYVFAAPTQWAFEISYMLMGAIFTLGLSYCLRNNAHVNVDILPSVLPRRANAAIEVVAFGGMTVVLVWLTVTLGEGVARTYRTGEGSDHVAQTGKTLLVYAERHEDIEAAIAREKLVKKWRREWKFALIEAENPGWNDLRDVWFGGDDART